MNKSDRIYNTMNENLPSEKIVISYFHIIVLLAGGTIYQEYFLLTILVVISMIVPIRYETLGRKRYVFFMIGIGITATLLVLIQQSLAGTGLVASGLLGGLIGVRFIKIQKNKEINKTHD